LGILAVVLELVADHFTQFGNLGEGSKVRQSIMQLIWFVSVWGIWKERDNMIFNSKECSIMPFVDRIKPLSFLWLKAKFTSFAFNYHS